MALVALSGCSGLVPGGGNESGGNGPGGADGTPTASPYAAGYAASGVTNATAAVDAHESALLSTSGFAVTYSAKIETGDGTTTVDYDQRVETSSREVLTRTNISGGGTTGTLAQYYHNGTIYQRSESAAAGGVQYSNRSGQYELRSFTGTRLVQPLVANVSYGSSEVVTHEGERAVRYTDATLQNGTQLLGRNVDPANVSSFQATLVVDSQGVVRHVEYSATIDASDRRTVDVTVDVASGDVTVDRPSWVAKA